MIAPSLAQIKALLHTWAERETGITFIFARQDKPRPKFPYGTIWAPNPGIRLGAYDEIRENNAGDFEQHGLRTTSVSLNIYGVDANSLMSKLRDSLDWPLTIEEFSAIGVAVIGENGPNDLTAVEDTQNVERSQLDLTLQYNILRVPEEDRELSNIEEVHVTHEDSPTGDEDIVIGPPS